MKKLIGLLLTFTLLISIFCQDAYCQVQDNLKSYIRQNFSNALAMSGMRNFDGYCGVCVSYQLLASGITASITNFNGNQAYDYFASKASSSGGYQIITYPASAYPMKNVLNILDTTPGSGLITPTLLGFTKGTASDAGQTYGHTLLIYAVSDGYVYYADSMYPTVDESVRILSIDDFCRHYSDYPETLRNEFVYEGAIQFCNFLPSSLKISSDKYMYAVGEEIRFDISAIGSANYFIGIDKNGQRVMTSNASDVYTTSFVEPGIYTAYFTAANKYGFSDSTKIMFEVMNQAPVDQWIGVSKQQASVGEIVPMCFDARYATAYFIGITNPDGSFTAVNTNGANSYNLCFNAPGTYSVYVTCVNIFGDIDTAPVSIIIQ